MRNTLRYLILLAIVIALGACTGQHVVPLPESAALKEAPPAPALGVASRDVASREVVDSNIVSTETSGWDAPIDLPNLPAGQEERFVVYSGTIVLVVQDAGQAATDIAALAAKQGGYVANSNLYLQGGVRRGTIVIRVPAEKYQDTLAALRALAVRVEKETTNSEDVTQEYTDLRARKVNLEHTEQALQKLLDERLKVGRTQDILEVYRELSNVRGQIEQIEGRLRYLTNLAAMSTISIELVPDVLQQPVATTGWEPQGIAKSALQALVSALQVLGTLAIWAVIFLLPLLIVVLIPLWVLVRFVRRVLRRRAARA
ncbi:MAG: hypothetical protein DDG58_01870 [Ardenticatenia bacterium]|jgi:hypothetical protein|nr:MAG: hypothetical protein DDG58_01870 [Ardenticatenia bacterium]